MSRLLVLALCVSCAIAQDYDKEIEARVKQLLVKNGAGSNAALKGRLIEMAKRDQAVRTPKYVSDHASPGLVQKQEGTDDRLTAELKQIVAENGWPTIRLVGLKASENAALILAHSRDHDFQRRMIPRLQELAESGQILGSSIAGITDKVLIADGKPQRFGTQFTWSNGRGAMLPVEDPEHLDQLRARYLLPPMAEYKKMMAQLYKMRVD